MKKIVGLLACLLLVALCAAASADVRLDEKHFPDKAFREQLSLYYDSDSNGVLSDGEIKKIKDLTVFSNALKSMKGVEYLTSLTDLTFFGEVTSVDLSKNTKLVSLMCLAKLKSLDVSHNTKLKRLICYGNQFTKLDVSKCPNLCKLVQEKPRCYDPNNYEYDFWRYKESNAYGDLAVGRNVKVIAGSKVSKPSDTVVVHNPDVVYDLKLKVTAPAAGASSSDRPVLTETTKKCSIDKKETAWLGQDGKAPKKPYTFEAGKTYQLTARVETSGKYYKFYAKPEVTVKGGTLKKAQVKPYQGDTDANYLIVVISVTVDADEVTADGGVYQLDHEKKTATLTGPAKKTQTGLTVPETVSANGKTYKVTKIAAGACKGMGKLKKLVIGGNVSKIGKEAFFDCGKLKSITVKTKKLKKDSIGAKAFDGIYKKAVFKCPDGKARAYAKYFKKAGAPDKAEFR